MTLLTGHTPKLGPAGTEQDRYNEKAFAELLSGFGPHSPGHAVLKKLASQILVSTTSTVVRNAAALALVDLDAREETDALLAVLNRPEMAKRAGTLLFALDELGAAIPLDLILQLIQHGSYEAKAEVVLLVQAGRLAVPSSSDELDEGRRCVTLLTTSTDIDTKEAAAAVLRELP